MRWGRNLRLSVRALSRARTRTALSVGGVAVGIASVVLLIGAGAGAERAVRQTLEALGRNLLLVTAERTETSPLRGISRVRPTLTVEDWQAIAGAAPGVLRTAPVAAGELLAVARGRAVRVRIAGTTPAFRETRSFPVVAGRFLDAHDLRQAQRVAVVGALVVEELFDGESPLGEWLRLDGVPFRIVGVARKRGVSPDGANEDELVIVPLTAAMRRLLDRDALSFLYVQGESEEALPAAQTAITALLRDRHGEEDFDIQDQTAIVRAQRQAGGSLSRIASGLGALALGLGGIGVLAVSLLSVRERYGEIGLRLAVGGRPRDILLQFLTEAVLISALGGVVGLGVGAAGIGIGAAWSRWPMLLSWEAVVYPLSISVAIAVIFGAYPALRAARLDPIRALTSR